jgi:hypothetical protein
MVELIKEKRVRIPVKKIKARMCGEITGIFIPQVNYREPPKPAWIKDSRKRGKSLLRFKINSQTNWCPRHPR